MALILGWLLPLVLGVALIAALPRNERGDTGAGELAWTLGSGWFIGALLLTFWMRVLSAASVQFSALAIGVPLMLAAALLLGLAWRRRRAQWAATLRGAWRAFAGKDLAGWPRAAWLALLAWLALRFALLLAEVVWRPLYPWDAWTQWATKARVWYELKSMVPFVPVAQWLEANGAAYYDAAPHYPGTVPLWQVWSSLLLGQWDDALMNLPWWCTGVALTLAVFGFLRGEGFEPLAALAGTWLVAAMPILDVHVALAGYADLPMAACLTLAALAGYRWIQSRSPSDLVPALLFAATLPLIKNPGRIWLPLLLPGLVVALWPRYGQRIVAGAFAAAAVALLVLAQTNFVLLGYRMHLTLDLPWHGLIDAYFTLANWHLLWYAVVGAAILGRRHLLAPTIAPLTAVVGGGLMFLIFGFAFTNARIWVEDQSTVNRATLHLAPLLFVWVILVFRAWARDTRTAQVPAAPAES